MTASGAPRGPLEVANVRAQGYRRQQMEHLSAPARAAPQQPRAIDAPNKVAGEIAAANAVEQDYYAGRSIVNTDAYFLGVINQFKDDSSVMNPMGVTIRNESADPTVTTSTTTVTSDAEALMQQLADKLTTRANMVDLVLPIGHSAIDDTRVYFDTLILSRAYSGYASGEIPMQFVDINGTSPPDRIVKITLTPFNFPHIYTANTTVFDMFYFRSVFMTVRFVPSTHLIQSAQPNDMFTYELYVEDIDSSAVYLRPLEQTFCLKQPISVTGDLTVRFQTRSPTGTGFTNCPIPPTRIRAIRTATGPLPTPFTTFALQDGVYIGAIAPPAATYTVPILFQNYNTGAAITPLEVFLVDQIGYQSLTFVAPNLFNIAVDTTLYAGTDIYVFVPKNSVAFTMRFSCLQSTRTNDLFPLHT